MMTLDEFMALPTKRQWQRELNGGWAGPDGSSQSLDDIMGVRIGVTSTRWEDSRLPANLHDWRYRLGRRYGLPGSYRKVSDAAYRDDCAARTDAALVGWRRRVARWRAAVRYRILRLAGRPAWTHEARVTASQ